jgi:tRNA(Ile)-lysidine synthase TilS/MesJ
MVEINLGIAQPPWGQVGKKLESMCRKALYDFDLIPKGTDSIGVALSGGKDSLSLLFLLKAIAGRGHEPWRIVAIHIHGAYSCGAGVDPNYLQMVCDALDVKLVVVKTDQKLEDLECYSCSRDRRSLLFEAAKQNGINTIAFGHHREDQIQTLLMNLLHKGEFAGLLPKMPMIAYGVTIIRPLIYVEEDLIRNFARHYGFARITCQCPVGQDSMRKKTQQLIEEIQLLYPNVRANLAHAAHHYGATKAIKDPFHGK